MLSFTVKIYITSVTKNNEVIDFDSNKISASVSCVDPNYPIVKIKKLTAIEIDEHTHSKRHNSKKSTKHEIASASERESGMVTRAKKKELNEPKKVMHKQARVHYAYSKRNLSDECSSESTISNKIPQIRPHLGSIEKSSTSKRKSDTVYLTRAKKRKLDEATVHLLPVMNEQLDHEPKKVMNKQSDPEPLQAESKANVVAELYNINEVVWAKIKGSVPWPARITSISTTGLKRYEVVWFNDYRKSRLFRSQIFKFYKHFSEYSKHFSKSIGVETAAKEALLYLSEKS